MTPPTPDRAEYVWRYLSRGHLAYVHATTGRVVAEIHECLGGGWRYGDVKYIDEAAAKRAVEGPAAFHTQKVPT